MAKIFEEPSFELLEMSKEDVLTASGLGSGDSAEVEGGGMPGGSNDDPFS